MPCPRCGTENPDRANFCFSCGLPLRESAGARPSGPAAAPPAGTAGPSAPDAPGDPSGISGDALLSDAMRRLMPGQFVDKLMASKGRVEGERRIVTILFADVRGSTALAESLDPEDVMEIMNGAFEAMISPVARYGGTLARLMGDGILAFFGAPVAHEDDPERACRAGLDILAGVRSFAAELERERGVKGFNVRVGINTGLVVVGEVGNGLRVEYTAMGDAVNLAARMESTAEPGTVRITDNTRKLVAGKFEAVSLGELAIKGKSRPVRVFNLTGVKRRATPPHRESGLYSPLVGRRTETAVLRDALAGLREGKSSVIGVIGEAGVGKSRLVSEAEESSSGGIRWVKCRAVPYGTRTSYSMARHLVCSLLGAAPESASSDLARSLQRTLAEFPPEQAADIAPYLGWLLNIPAARTTDQMLLGLDADTFTGRIAGSVCALVAGLAGRSPVVLLWEDLHWADPSSVGLLGGLLDSLTTAPVLFLLVSRPEKESLLSILGRASERYASSYHAIELKPLTTAESRTMLENMLGGTALPARVRTDILERTGGNAFFLEEVLRSLIDRGDLPKRAKRARRSAKAPVTVPETIQGVITARVDCLSPANREVLHTSSVVGRTFRSTVLALVLGVPADDGSLDASLGELARREFIAPRNDAGRGASGTAGDREYSFRHGITQDVVYASLLLAQRKILHRRVGESIEKMYADRKSEFAATLALHFDKAGVAPKALLYTLDAAIHAKRAYANHEAVLHYTRALDLAAAVGPEAGVLARIHDSLGDVCALMARYPDAVGHFDSALGRMPDALTRAVVMRKKARVYEQWGKYEEADRELQAALGEIRLGADPIEEARITTGLARVCFRRGDAAAAATLGESALAVMDAAGDGVGTAEACNILGSIYSGGGESGKAIALYDRCLAIWEEAGNLGGLAVTYNNLGQIYHRLERWEDAALHYRRSLELSEKIGNRYGIARTCDNLSQVYAGQGRQEEALKCLKRAVDIFREIGREGSAVVPEMWMQSGTL